MVRECVGNNSGNNGDNVVTNTFIPGTLTGAVDPLAISLDSKMDVSCFGGNDGHRYGIRKRRHPPITFTWSMARPDQRQQD